MRRIEPSLARAACHGNVAMLGNSDRIIRNE
jgi:hypothetical protein